jgi:hypothetical protein
VDFNLKLEDDMEFQWTTGEDMSAGSQYLDMEGEYHMAIQEIDTPALKNDGSIISNSLFGVTFAVLAGPPGTENKIKKEVFWTPNTAHRDGGRMERRKIDRFLLAANLIQPGELNASKNLDLNKAKFQQLCVRLIKRTDNQGREHLQVKFADIYHVDDPEAANFPRNDQMLNLIKPHLRRIGLRSQGMPVRAPAAQVDDFSF